ncbi:gamma carbonic anhydrase family protein [Paenibacillus sp. LMG 31456]|uniref:Gamma carbonic anhydrase family protein n=1 Tax=Paenibacillus foliorum TaxID=2654974 RepID=A0A972K380_9BACL|nr:gamma carbonic anhydrase family protein [Paenibacillus foliorum]NOU97536.1 gamma carbonic anhydrase family protein [Paenibacillus foliorum]
MLHSYNGTLPQIHPTVFLAAGVQIIGDEVSVGHGAIIHGCRIGKGTLIGMGAIVLNGADVGEYALVGAGSLVTENKQLPSHTLSLGSPAKVIRELIEADLQRMQRTMESYCVKGSEYRHQVNPGNTLF